jgi:hypothetical protein
VKTQGKVKLLALAALLICGISWALLLCRRQPSARIQFTEIRWNDGFLTVHYDYTVSSRAFLRETEFENGTKTGDCKASGSPFSIWTFPKWPFSEWPHSGSFTIVFSPPPLSENAASRSLLVETGRSYTVKLHDQLQVYNFTNKSGVAYQAQFSLEPMSTK